MAENATIDKISYMNLVSDTGSAQKTSANSSNDFANVLSSVNKNYTTTDTKKTYSNNKTESSNDNSKVTKDDDSSNKNNAVQNKSKKENKKVKEDNSDNKSSQKEKTDSEASTTTKDDSTTNTATDDTPESTIQQKTVNIKEAAEEDIRERIANKALSNQNVDITTANIIPAVDAKAVIEELKQQRQEINNQIANNVKDVTNNAATPATPAVAATATTDATSATPATPGNETAATNAEKQPQTNTQQPTSTESNNKMTSTQDITQSVPADNILDLMAPSPNTAMTEIASQSSDSETIAKTSAQQNLTEAQNDFDVKLANSTKSLNDIMNTQTSKISAQSNAQQDLSTINTTQQNSTAQTEQTQQPQQAQQIQQQSAQTANDTTAQAPVIQVNTELLAADTSINKPAVNVSTKDNANKSAISQDIIDKTNAKIEDVKTTITPETSSKQNSNSNNNSLSQQNAQEQVIKLSIEDNSAASQTNNQNVNLASVTNDSTAQTNFSKTLDTAQTQQPTQTYVPKELSQTEIMSQVHSKLNNLENVQDSKINIILKPENLGKISVELVNSKDGLTAKMTTDNAQVKEILDKNLDNLKDSLGSQGINVNNVSVKVENTQKQDLYSFEDNQNKGQNKGFSQNSQGNNKDESFEDEMENAMAPSSDSDSEPDELASAGLRGYVDYKV